MKTKLLLLLVCLCWLQAKAQSDPAVQSYRLITGKNQQYHPYIQYKSYYLFTLMQELPELRKVIHSDLALRGSLETKLAAVKTALKTCSREVSCIAAAMKFSDAEIQHISTSLLVLYQKENVLAKTVANHLLPSGYYGMYVSLEPSQILIKAWEQDAKAINHTIDVYIAGKKPNYPRIDSISFGPKDKEFPDLVASNAVILTGQSDQLFFEPSLHFAQSALELNGRSEAADYEPMTAGVNRSAIAQIKKTNFANYKYSVVMVPGAGPEDRETELSAGGITRCRIAAIQYQKGLAPFIVVSGGRVHPYKTKYNEAWEMKKFMVNMLHIPESAIIMQPHARHTTTNFRNCARLIFRYGMPMDKPAIVSTTASTLVWINQTLLERCKKELGYEPYRNMQIISANEAEFYPSSRSLQIDFDEPLDP